MGESNFVWGVKRRGRGGRGDVGWKIGGGKGKGMEGGRGPYFWGEGFFWWGAGKGKGRHAWPITTP